MRKAKIGVIGGGRVGISHIQGILKSPHVAELGGIIELNQELADKVAAEYNTNAFYTLESALEYSDIDAYVVCLPHHLHYPLGKQILMAKKHVLIEKPLGISLDEVESLRDISRENGVHVMSAQSRRFYSSLQIAKSLLPQIGGPTNLLYNFACIFTKETAPIWWREEKKTGGLVIGMLGSHSIDTTLWMNEGKKPVRLYCEARKITDVFEGNDAATITIAFDDGTIATNYLSICNDPYRHECLIEGRNGSIAFDHYGDHVGTIGVSSTNLYLNGKKIDTPEEPDCFTLQIREFASSIIEEREPSTSANNVYETYRLLEAARESSINHVAIDLERYALKV